jgi:hypothetical protein
VREKGEEATRASLSYLLLSEKDACLFFIGHRDRREHLQKAYWRAIKEACRLAITNSIGL